MKIYGYKRRAATKRRIEMREVKLCSNPARLRELARFIKRCADGMEKDPVRWDHQHFAINGKVNFIIANPGITA